MPSCLKALPFCCTAVRTTWREIHHLLLMKSRVSTHFDTLTSFFWFSSSFSCWTPKRTWVPKFASGSSFSAALPRSSSKPSRWMANNKSSRSPPHAYTEAQTFCASDTSDTSDDTLWLLMTLNDTLLWIFQISIALWEVEILIIFVRASLTFSSSIFPHFTLTLWLEHETGCTGHLLYDCMNL